MAPGTTTARPARRWTPSTVAVRRELGRSLELSAVVGFAVAYPVLGPFGEAPEVFVAAGADRAQVVAFGFTVALVPVVVVAAAAAASRLAGVVVRSWTQTVLVAALGALYVTGVALSLGASRWVGVAAGVAAAAAFGVAHRRWAPARQWLRYASPAPLVFLVLFLVVSPTSAFVFPASPSVAPATTTAADEPPPVVVIVFDELPTLSLVDGAGGIDRDLFPNFARLADTSTWYRDATTVAPATADALPALLTGRMPTRAGGPPALHTNHPDNLFTLLAPTHDLTVVEWTTAMCPTALCPAVDRSISDDAARLFAQAGDGGGRSPLGLLLGQARTLWWNRSAVGDGDRSPALTMLGHETADELARPGLEFLSSLEPAVAPTFDYLHTPVPHLPWSLLPSGEHYDAPATPRGAEYLGWGEGPDYEHMAAAGRTRHLLQVQWADRLLGAIMDRLEELDRWDDAVVVVTADHGVSFTPGELMRFLRPGNQAEVAWVPLLVKRPGQGSGEVVDDNVLLVDVVPTIADALGLDVPWTVHGESALGGTTRPAGDKPIVSESPGSFPSADGDLVDLDVDGLAAIASAPAVGDPGDPLRLWRTGEHGNLVGIGVDELGVCEGDASTVVTVHGDLPGDGGLERGLVPLWVAGTVQGPGRRDVVVVIDGAVVGWDRTKDLGRSSELGVLLAAPLIADVATDDTTAVRLYERSNRSGCKLEPLTLAR